MLCEQQWRASAALRDQFNAEIEEIKSDEEAANWAYWVVGAKNTMTTLDAERVEQAFQARLTSVVTEAANGLSAESQNKAVFKRQ